MGAPPVCRDASEGDNNDEKDVKYILS